MTSYHPGVYAYASWQGLSIAAAAEELASSPETDRNRVKWERVGRMVADMVGEELATLRAQLAAVTAERDAMTAEIDDMRAELHQRAMLLDDATGDPMAPIDLLRAVLAERDALRVELERAFVALQDYGMPLNCALGRWIAEALQGTQK